MQLGEQESPRVGFHPWRRLLLGLVLVLAAVGFYFLAVSGSVSWNTIREQRVQLRSWVGEHYGPALLLFGLAYILITGLSLPVGAGMTLVGGALFGRWVGLLVVSFASTTGATLAFLISRYLFRAWVERRFAGQLAAINRGLERDGAFYLIALRFTVVVPYWLVNLVMGLTRMPVRTFWWASQLGMLPLTAVYINAGTEVAQIESPRDAVSPTVLISLAMIGLVPLLLRLVLPRWKKQGPPA